MAVIKVTVEGTEYEWDSDRLLVAEARELKTYTGFTPPRWLAALDESDPDAIAALIFMSKKRAGETLRFSDLDTLDYADIQLDFVEPEPDPDEAAAGGGAEAAPAADPTPASGGDGTTPTPATGATSDPSPTTSSTPPPPSEA
ncbi:hypothetical protein LXH13_06130 [Streptomyces spinosirectus]|uniref:hypothetical protein n=1 Tax=Streptomyces TaxID=1883 RepID=UPI000FFF618D|nr:MULTISPECIES: hypothetical protein [Streptomyces]MBY8342017.1 hypothetical protein [Streptomyces plumbidurans]UIR16636.1 hypothetical protein LXH13_06130 [Streptomyces spinosirectus]